MSYRISVVSVMGRDYHPTRRLMEAAQQRGHVVDILDPYRLWPGFRAGDAVFSGEEAAGFLDTGLPDAVLPRQGADIGSSCLALAYQFKLMGIPVINDFDAIRLSRHQFYTLQALSSAQVPFPDSVFINSADGFFPAVRDLGGYPVVIKQVSNRQGSGVFKVDSADMARSILAENLGEPQKERQGLLIQRYLSTDGRSDVRVLVVGDRVVGAQVLVPRPGDFRANFHLGGQSRQFELTPAIEELSIRAARAVGLDIAGIDLMMAEGEMPRVVEVNYAPGFQGLEAATGQDIAGEIVDYVLRRAAGQGGLSRLK